MKGKRKRDLIDAKRRDREIANLEDKPWRELTADQQRKLTQHRKRTLAATDAAMGAGK